MQSYLQRWCIMIGPLAILEEAPPRWWDTILNPSLLIPCQVPLSIFDTWYYDRVALYCISCALSWEVDRNKWGQMTSLNRKSFDKIKLVMKTMVKVFYIVVSLAWTIFDRTHCSPCFWTMCVKEEENPTAMSVWGARPPACNLQKCSAMGSKWLLSWGTLSASSCRRWAWKCAREGIYTRLDQFVTPLPIRWKNSNEA